VLTDYHLHLQPDDHTERARAAAAWEPLGGHLSPGWIGRYVEAARARAIGEIALTEHVHRFAAARDWHPNAWWREDAAASLAEYVEGLRAARDGGLPVLVGIEMDWLPDRRAEIAGLLADHHFDVVLGSVHWLGELAVDHPDYPAWSELPAAAVWERYLEQLTAAAGSGLFDVLAHPDLPKVFGHPIPPGLASRWDDAIAAIADAGVAVECSSAGLRKPVRELYPEVELLARFRAAGVPVTLGSDAHAPADVGRDYPTAVAALRGAGYGTITRFAGREPRQVALAEWSAGVAGPVG
jgi:histidinol-phosphatase (PHP family)